MTIEEILKEAFDRIQYEHRVALESVSYSTIDASTAANNRLVITSIEFSGETLRES